jgi:hypothetical protein
LNEALMRHRIAAHNFHLDWRKTLSGPDLKKRERQSQEFRGNRKLSARLLNSDDNHTDT